MAELYIFQNKGYGLQNDLLQTAVIKLNRLLFIINLHIQFFILLVVYFF